jgi:type VI secretion system VasI/ImpG family protein
MDLLDYYRDNLVYIRALAAEFAGEFPKIAGRLSLSEFECQDPYIERLLEGTAFLSARVEKKLDEGYKPFLESVLNSIAPASLYPIPSGAVLELGLNYSNEQVRQYPVLEAGALFDARIPTINAPCRFSSYGDSPLAPVSIAAAEYAARDMALLGLNVADAVSALTLALSPASGGPSPAINELRFFVNLSDDETSLLLRLLMHDVAGVYVRAEKSENFTALEGLEFGLPMPGENSGHELKGNSRGVRLLRDYMSYPAFFKFFSIKNCAPVFRSYPNGFEMAILFKRREQSLVTGIKANSFKLNCVPVLNLFSKRSDRISMDREAYEYHIVPDRAGMRDYEVVSIKRLEFFNERNERLFSAAHFYDEDILEGSVQRNFFSQSRRRTLFDRKSTRRSSYEGSEVFVSFAGQDKKLEDASQFAADLVCTNRDLPLLLAAEAELSPQTPLARKAVLAAHPTRPDYPVVERGNSADFAKLSHINFNLSAMLWQDGEAPLKMLQTMLRNYSAQSEEATEQLIKGIAGLESKPKTFRFIKNGAIFFEYGWQVALTLDEQAFAGMGYYTFAYIIGEMLKSFTPINSLIEVRFYTKQSGHIAVWKLDA